MMESEEETNFRIEGRCILARLLLLHNMRGGKKPVLNSSLIVDTDLKHRTTHGEPEYNFVFLTVCGGFFEGKGVGTRQVLMV